MNKRGIIWLAVILFIIAFCGAFYLYHLQGRANDSPISKIADFNATASASKNLTETSNNSNQSVFSVPLEKPPFID